MRGVLDFLIVSVGGIIELLQLVYSVGLCPYPQLPEKDIR